jgi:hypothetical protein
MEFNDLRVLAEGPANVHPPNGRIFIDIAGFERWVEGRSDSRLKSVAKQKVGAR